MQLITTYEAYIELLNRLTRGKNILISTYGITFNKDVIDILENTKSFKLIVGLYDRKCSPSCKHCEHLHRTKRAELLKAQIKFPNSIVGVKAFHKKIVIIGDTVIVGGFNLTGSTFEDNAIITTNKAFAQKATSLFMHSYSHKQEKLREYTPSLVPFGKYKGMTFSELATDHSYVEHMKSVLPLAKFKLLTNT